MQRGAIAFMLRECVARVPRIQFHHDAVPRDLGDDTRRRDAETPRIAADQCRVLDWKWPHGQPVDERMIRGLSERGDGPAHGLMGGAQDIDPIDLDVIA